MSNEYGLSRGLLVLFTPLLLSACAAQPSAASPGATEPAPDQASCATAGCLNDELGPGASFEAGEPEDYAWQASGLGIFERVEGEGPSVTAGARVTFEYTGYRLDGCAFDATALREPLTAPLEGMIPGMREGLTGMRVGGQRRLYIPPELAYGDAGAGELIGPDEVLVFEIELVELR